MRLFQVSKKDPLRNSPAVRRRDGKAGRRRDTEIDCIGAARGAASIERLAARNVYRPARVVPGAANGAL